MKYTLTIEEWRLQRQIKRYNDSKCYDGTVPTEIGETITRRGRIIKSSRERRQYSDTLVKRHQHMWAKKLNGRGRDLEQVDNFGKPLRRDEIE